MMNKVWNNPGGAYWSICEEMSKQTHLLIAGTTGSGKSVLVKSFVYSMLALHTPASMRFLFVDCKGGCELGMYRDLPHTLAVVTTVERTEEHLNRIIKLMDRRFEDLQKRGLRETDEKDVWVIIDELAVLLSDSKKIEQQLAKIMRLGRAVHIHTLLCTQSPNRSKGGGLSPLICQNVTSAIALRCRSSIESRQIIGIGGAEQLPQYGKGYFWSPSGIRMIDIPLTPETDLDHRIRQWKDNIPTSI